MLLNNQSFQQRFSLEVVHLLTLNVSISFLEETKNKQELKLCWVVLTQIWLMLLSLMPQKLRLRVQLLTKKRKRQSKIKWCILLSNMEIISLKEWTLMNSTQLSIFKWQTSKLSKFHCIIATHSTSWAWQSAPSISPSRDMIMIYMLLIAITILIGGQWLLDNSFLEI